MQKQGMLAKLISSVDEVGVPTMTAIFELTFPQPCDV
jgi:hypothetical protein